MSEEIEEAYANINQRIEESAKKSGRSATEIKLIAVSKRQPLEKIRALKNLGHITFAESKQQEGSVKVSALPSNLEWHFIGGIQKNKVRKILGQFTTIHSVHSLELAQYMNQVASEMGKYPKIYLQVNLANEAVKQGFSILEIRDYWEELLNLDRLEIQGLMILPPIEEAEEDTRKWFSQLRLLAEELSAEAGIPGLKLSMGMSHDFELAIAEGATEIRVGSALFGKRLTGLR